MSAIYLAARYSRYYEMQALATELQGGGHTVTSRWCTSEPLYDNTDERVMQQGTGLVRAQHDLEDVRACDTLVAIAEPMREPTRGGRHVELGYALGLGKQVILLGEPENVFHLLPEVETVLNISYLFDLLAEREYAHARP